MYLKDVLLFVSLITMANPYSLPLLISTTDLSGITSTPVSQRDIQSAFVPVVINLHDKSSHLDPPYPLSRQEDCPRMHFGVCGHA